MDALMVAVTLVALVIAGGAVVLTFSVLREDRRRSAARLAALAERLEEGPAAAEGGHEPSAPEPRMRHAQVPVQAGSPRNIGIEPGGSGQAAAPTTLFAATVGQPEGPSRLILIAGAALCFLLVLGVAAAMLPREDGSAAGQGAEAATPDGPLELLSLRHSREGHTMTITGLVRNPENGAAVRRLSAVAFLFDRSGSFLASGRAPLDFVALQPGDESPFVVSIPGAGAVHRYRISFRTEEGALTPHVDRRSQDGDQGKTP
jgi:hypothetical protein